MSKEMESMDDCLEEIDRSFRKMKEGDVLTGTILDISEEEIILDLRCYAQGIIKTEDLSEDPEFCAMTDLKVGSELEATVIEVDDGRGNIRLSLIEATKELAWDKLKEYLVSETVVSVVIQEVVPSGVVTYLEGIRAFIPASQLDVTYVEDLESFVGRKLEAVVITADETKKKLVLSAKRIAKQKREEELKRKVAMLVPGAVFEGTVESLMPYGAFVSIGEGLSGLVHISRISQRRIRKPSEVLKEGQKVLVKVLNTNDGKISLSMKEFEESIEEVQTDEVEAFEYKSEGEATTNLGSLLAGLKLDLE